MKLKNKIAVITGGSSGIGYATAQLFIKEGATVVITGQNIDKLKLAQEKLGPSAMSFQADVTKAHGMKKTYQKISDKFAKKIDIVVANAGISPPAKSLEETSEEM